MAVASQLAVARVSLDCACPMAAGRRGGLAAFPTARTGARPGGVVMASPPTVEAVRMTEPLTKEDVVAYHVPDASPRIQVNKYYDLATSFYEYGWGESFHFAHRLWNFSRNKK